MTKTKALEQMRKYSRNVVDPELARKIAKAFGYSLKDLEITARKVDQFYRMNYSEETAKLTAVSIYELAQGLNLAIVGKQVYSNMNGLGSYADDITEKACNNIEQTIS